MKPVSLKTIAGWCGGTLLSGDPAKMVSGVSKDTRTIIPGDLYIALRGDHFDGNQFLEAAAARGAAGSIVDADVSGPGGGFGVIQVPDGLAALQQLAVAARRQLSLHAICITGSNGKTSTKDFAAAILGTRFQVHKTQGNLNNHIGVPLTILDASENDAVAVWEIGMNHPGEIAPLAGLCRPHGAIITNIGIAHIEYMGSAEAIAAEKGSLLRAIPADGFAVLNADDPFCDTLAGMTSARVIRVGLEAGDVHARDIVQDREGVCFLAIANGESAKVRLKVNGLHMVRNALLAIAAGRELGVSLEDCARGLNSATLTGGRLQPRRVGGLNFLDDSYNANPDSMEAALETLSAVAPAGRRIAVLGRMGELGSHAQAGYERVGQCAARTADLLIGVGQETQWMIDAAQSAGAASALLVKDTEAAARTLLSKASDNDTILIKGSRSARMEKVIDAVAESLRTTLSA